MLASHYFSSILLLVNDYPEHYLLQQYTESTTQLLQHKHIYNSDHYYQCELHDGVNLCQCGGKILSHSHLDGHLLEEKFLSFH